MDIKTIVFSMMVILTIVFTAAYFLIPREKQKMEKEAAYSEAVLKARMTGTKLDRAKARELGILLGKTEDQITRDLN